MPVKLSAFTKNNPRPLDELHNGSRMRPEFKEIISDEGIPTVIKCGEYDFQAQIDSFADECDLYKILDRLGVSDKSPDVVAEALAQFRPPMFDNMKFGDISDMPDNIHEVSKFYRDSVAFFNGLPADVRKEYNYSVDKFFANFDDFVKKYAAPSSVPSPAPSPDQSNTGGDSNE